MTSIAVSRDGRYAYVASNSIDAVAVLTRDKRSGNLTPLTGTNSCVSEHGSGGICAVGKALLNPISIVISPDERHLYVASQSSNAVAVFARNKKTGALTQLAGTDGCISEDGTGGACAIGKALLGPSSITVSPEGDHVYVASQSSNAIAVFARNKLTGALAQLAGTSGCVSDDGTSGACTDSKALDDPNSIAITPDGRHVYVASGLSNAIAAFVRESTTGNLTQLSGTQGCVSEDTTGGNCSLGRGLVDAFSVAISPDGRHVYSASFGSSAVAVFMRNSDTGALTQLGATSGCVSETGTSGSCVDGKGLLSAFGVTVTPDGRHVYVASGDSNGVAAFTRDQTTGALTQLGNLAGCLSEFGDGVICADGKGLNGANFVTVSRDGRHVYVGSSGIAILARDSKTGALLQFAGPDCVSETGAGFCYDGNGLNGANSLAVSPDGQHVYVTSFQSDAVTTFSRRRSDGALIQLSGVEGCVAEDGDGFSCADGKAIADPGRLTISPDGLNVYILSGSGDSVAVFSRNPDTGVLTQLDGSLGCIARDGDGIACTAARGLRMPVGIAVSPDGRNVYVTSANDSTLAIFARDLSTGALTQLTGTDGCISNSGSGGLCAGLATAFDVPLGIEVTSDGRHVYVAVGLRSAVTIFARNTLTGVLTQLSGINGCISDEEDGLSDRCTPGRGVAGASAVVSSSDGRHVYVASNGSIAAFSRNRTTGALTQLNGVAGCISADAGSNPGCAVGEALGDLSSIAISRDGRNVYVTSRHGVIPGFVDVTLTILSRNKNTGVLVQPSGIAKCISNTGSVGTCVDAKALDVPSSVVVSPDGRHVYVTSMLSDSISLFNRQR